MARLLYVLLLVCTSLWRVFGQATLSVNGVTIALVAESVGSVQACVELTSGPLASNTTVGLETRDDSAIGPDDYSILSEQLTFISGSTSGDSICRDIQIEQDSIPETFERFNIVLTADGSPDMIATVLINDDDVAVIGLEESAYSVLESDGFVTVCAVLLPQGAELGRDVRFNFDVQDGSATRALPRDYIFSELTDLMFTPEILRVCTNISITGDLVVEDTEFFTVFLESNNNAMINGSAIVEIIDAGGAAASIQETDISIIEGTSGEICIVLENGDLERNLSVTLTTTAGTAGANDFIPLANGVLTIPSTATVSTAVCFNITVTSDMIVENNETFTISVETSNPDDVILGATTATVTIVDDDSAAVSIQETEISILEGTSGEICIVLENGELERDVVVTLTTTEVTAGADDFSPLSNEVLTIPSTTTVSTAVCLNITVTSDMIVENNETFMISVETSNPNDVILGSTTATVTIVDGDSAAVSIQETEISILEGTSGEICIVLENGELERDVVVTLTTTEVTAGANDFIPLSNEVLTIPSTATESAAVCLNITVTGDMIVEENEIFTISVETSNPNDVIMGSTTATVTIVDDDSATVSIQETVSIMEGTTGQICIVLEDVAGGLERAVSVTLTFTEGAGDFELADIVVIFPSTAVTNDMICRNIIAVDDIILEGDEVFTITVVPSNLNDVPGISMATVIIQDNGNEVNCGLLPNISNGSVVLDGVTFGSTANYTCIEGFVIMGNVSRTCGADEVWSGDEPSCEEVDCGLLLNISNGSVVLDGVTFGSTANYTCIEGFIIMGNVSRTCGADEVWSGNEPSCEVASTPTTGPVSPPSNDGRTIGIAVGVAVGATLLIIMLLIIVVVVYIVERRRRQQKYTLPFTTVYDNPQTGGGTTSSVEAVQPKEPPPDYNDVVGEGDEGSSARESAVIEPAVEDVDENASDGTEGASDEDEAASTNELIDVDVAPEKSELTLEPIEEKLI